jgi:hypothetical protein
VELFPSEQIGPELFVRIASHPSVRHYIKRRRLDSCHRSWVREYVAHDVDESNTTDSFWRDAGLALETVEDLLCIAKLGTAPAEKRVVAIRTLIRHFPWDLNEDARLNPRVYEGYEVPQEDGQLGVFVNAIAYWEEKVSCIQAEGVVLDHVRVCCNANGKVCAALNRCGEPVLPLEAPVLPDANEHRSGCFRSSYADRLRQREQVAAVGAASQTTCGGKEQFMDYA